MLATETANWKKVETLLDNISTSDVRYLFLLVVFILSLSFRFFLCVSFTPKVHLLSQFVVALFSYLSS